MVTLSSSAAEFSLRNGLKSGNNGAVKEEEAYMMSLNGSGRQRLVPAGHDVHSDVHRISKVSELFMDGATAVATCPGQRNSVFEGRRARSNSLPFLKSTPGMLGPVRVVCLPCHVHCPLCK